MRTMQFAALAAVAVVGTAFASSAHGGVYDYSYAPSYGGYPVSSAPACPSGQCYPGATAPSYSYTPSYSLSSYGSAAPVYGTGAAYGTSTCPNGNCGSCGPNGCCANGRCGTCPAGTCRSGNCPANCPNGNCANGSCPSGKCPNGNCANGQCTIRNRDLGRSLDGPNYTRPESRPEHGAPSAQYVPANWSRSPRSYDAGPRNRSNDNLESPFYN
jgi:hypothetical protein